ncbi:MAG: HD domain-containing protein [Desulfobulbaceae bacterium]|jgi:dGTPase|nr:HD domain-containing protein [Desulfobulbaceae bacterium]MDY0351223.1 HD domain-containing protein [Desulfobulbaceae bacterium]
MTTQTEKILFAIQEELFRQERRQLSPLAALSRDAVRRRPETLQGHRQPFAQDADRILHSKAYTRYIDKTQVFSLIDNDHITHRVLHVQMVSRIARTIGRFLGLNEDLIEAVALGHDIGHPPFGHEGEYILARLCCDHGLDVFQHNLQSIQFLERFEKKGKGLNLTLQVLDGILCHDGEVHDNRLAPARGKTFVDFDREVRGKGVEPLTPLVPMTLEGCVVRLSDTIAYIGRDIEDAIELELIDRREIPAECGRLLGTSNGTIVYTLVTDLVAHSRHVRAPAGPGDREHDWIGFSPEAAEAMQRLKRFNYERIYRNPAFKPDYDKIRTCYVMLFDHYLRLLREQGPADGLGGGLVNSMTDEYLAAHAPAAIVRDYIAGMTDEFFLRQAGAIGCQIPERRCLPG